MINERIAKAHGSWDAGKPFFMNKNIDKKIRMQAMIATVRPVLQYGISTQDIPNNEALKLQKKISKWTREIDEKERWGKAYRDNEICNCKRETNLTIRKRWNIANSKSILKRERINFLIKAKRTAAVTYLTFSTSINKEINEYKKNLELLQEKTKWYYGKHAYDKIEKLHNKCDTRDVLKIGNLYK